MSPPGAAVAAGRTGTLGRGTAAVAGATGDETTRLWDGTALSAARTGAADASIAGGPGAESVGA
jgi:hypothetical protein